MVCEAGDIPSVIIHHHAVTCPSAKICQSSLYNQTIVLSVSTTSIQHPPTPSPPSGQLLCQAVNRTKPLILNYIPNKHICMIIIWFCPKLMIFMMWYILPVMIGFSRTVGNVWTWSHDAVSQWLANSSLFAKFGQCCGCLHHAIQILLPD